jgi:hypothetical protein
VIASGGTVTGGRIVTGGTMTGGAIGTGGAGGSATGGIRMDAAPDTILSLDASTDAGKQCGGFAGIDCATGEICDLPTDTCQMADHFGTCKKRPEGCIAAYIPVCGCNGKTYGNDCERLVAGVAKRSDGECVATTCPAAAPANSTACGSTSLSCFYDNCPSTGRTQATCTNGRWVVQTAACTAIGCLGYPNSSFNCPSGKVCIVATGGTINATCVDNGCGAGPVSNTCVAGANGCTMGASPTSGVTFTCNTCPQGGCP